MRGQAANLCPCPRVARAFQPQARTWPSLSMATVHLLPHTCKAVARLHAVAFSGLGKQGMLQEAERRETEIKSQCGALELLHGKSEEGGSCLTRGPRRKSRPLNLVPSSASTTLGASTLSPVSSPCTGMQL